MRLCAYCDNMFAKRHVVDCGDGGWSGKYNSGKIEYSANPPAFFLIKILPPKLDFLSIYPLSPPSTLVVLISSSNLEWISEAANKINHAMCSKKGQIINLQKKEEKQNKFIKNSSILAGLLWPGKKNLLEGQMWNMIKAFLEKNLLMDESMSSALYQKNCCLFRKAFFSSSDWIIAQIKPSITPIKWTPWRVWHP